MKRRVLAGSWLVLWLGWFGGVCAQQLRHPAKRPNIVWLVADDMNWDSAGCFGGAAPDITPNIDRLAEQGMQFWHAHVNISICTPSRSVMLTGLSPQRNGAEGFQRIRPGTPTLPALLNEEGFLCGTIGKPLSQQELFRWSVTYTWQGKGDEDEWGRDPAIYRKFASSFFEMAKTSKQPFFLMASTHDPHDPFPGSGAEKRREGKKFYERSPVRRSYRSEEVKIPGYLPDVPGIRKIMANYCNAVKRADDMVGAVLEELEKAGVVDNTIVVFLSDHGMAFPGVKANCYPHSTRTPLVVRWPGKVKPGSDDREHMISCVDLQSTILESVGLPTQKSDGRSFLPLLKGEKQEGRDYVFTQFFHIHGKDSFPMRGVVGRKYAYVFNPWSNGERNFPRQWNGFRTMQKLAQTDPAIARRVQFLQKRVVEEFYDRSVDPECLVNLLEGLSPTSSPGVPADELRAALRKWMVQVGDSALDAFDQRDDPNALEKFMKEYTARATKEVEDLKEYEQRKGYGF